MTENDTFQLRRLRRILGTESEIIATGQVRSLRTTKTLYGCQHTGQASCSDCRRQGIYWRDSVGEHDWDVWAEFTAYVINHEHRSRLWHRLDLPSTLLIPRLSRPPPQATSIDPPRHPHPSNIQILLLLLFSSPPLYDASLTGPPAQQLRPPLPDVRLLAPGAHVLDGRGAAPHRHGVVRIAQQLGDGRRRRRRRRRRPRARGWPTTNLSAAAACTTASASAHVSSGSVACHVAPQCRQRCGRTSCRHIPPSPPPLPSSPFVSGPVVARLLRDSRCGGDDDARRDGDLVFRPLRRAPRAYGQGTTLRALNLDPSDGASNRAVSETQSAAVGYLYPPVPPSCPAPSHQRRRTDTPARRLSLRTTR